MTVAEKDIAEVNRALGTMSEPAPAPQPAKAAPKKRRDPLLKKYGELMHDPGENWDSLPVTNGSAEAERGPVAIPGVPTVAPGPGGTSGVSIAPRARLDGAPSLEDYPPVQAARAELARVSKDRQDVARKIADGERQLGLKSNPTPAELKERAVKAVVEGKQDDTQAKLEALAIMRRQHDTLTGAESVLAGKVAEALDGARVKMSAAGGLVVAGASAILSRITAAARSVGIAGETAAKYANVPPDLAQGVTRANVAMQRIDTAWDEFVLRVAAGLGPFIERAASVLEVIGFTGGHAFVAIAEAIGDGITRLAQWVDGIFGWQTATASAGDVAFNVLRTIAKLDALYWDSVKAAAGGVLYIVGSIIEGFGKVVGAIAESSKALDDLSKTLPDGVRGMLFGTAGGDGGLSAWANKAQKVGDSLATWGKNAVLGWGDSAKQVDEWFDGLQKKFNETQRLTPAIGLAGAFGKESKEAYSIIAKWQTSNQLAGLTGPENDPVAIAKKQLNEQKEQRKALYKIVGYLDQGTVVRVLNK
jgi:hypothetical protein